LGSTQALKTGSRGADGTDVRDLHFKHGGILAACAAALVGIALAVPATSAGDAKNAAAVDNPATTSAAASKIESTLKKGPAVVVARLPQGIVDDLAIVEASAAAGETRAPFLTLSTEDPAEAAELIQRFNVVTTPTILVADADNGIYTQINGYADRATIAQAVLNARR
jgi:hypothetical protein